MLKKLFLFLIPIFFINISFSIDLSGCYKKYIKVSAYYSPVYKQSFYYRWNFTKEVRLNGRWIRWASWKRVFNWMLAAWKRYKFWTKIYFPWLWVGQVEDRWSAIVHAGQRWQKYDRIDIWVGKWDKALMRALSFWKQVRLAYICPKWKKIKVWFDYTKFPVFKNFFEKTIWWIWLFIWRKDYWVKVLQTYLIKLWYLHTKATWYFGWQTKKAVMDFQKDYWIKTRYYGYFGPKTRGKLKDVLKKKWLYKESYEKKYSFQKKIDKKTIDKKKVLSELSIVRRWLYVWIDTKEVVIVQKYLKKLWYYKWAVSWKYDEQTKQAVSKFQLDKWIISKNNYYLAGYFGPQTRKIFKQEVLNSL